MQNKEALLLSFRKELDKILSYWEQHTVDDIHGGFFGRITNENVVVEGAMKGAVLHARILWSFAAAYRITNNAAHLRLAERAFRYMLDHFIDKDYGGVYWAVDADGAPLETRKQIYAIAFAVYGLSEYYRAGGPVEALSLAQRLYEDIERHSFDEVDGGYLEALGRDWSAIGDLRLSAKDANEKMSMNTHLHILEAYTNLYRVWKDDGLADRIRVLIGIFKDHIVDAGSGHLGLFFGAAWVVRSSIISYGHDIEASWLLLEAAEVLEDEELIGSVRALAVRIADAAAEGLGPDGSMYYEREGAGGHLNGERHWWVQAEAVVGFLNAWQLTGASSYYEKFTGAWNYTVHSIIDPLRGEWYWGRKEDGSVMEGEDRAGFWKCPYHNSRMCMEVIRRLGLSVLFVLLLMGGVFAQAGSLDRGLVFRNIQGYFYDSAAGLYRETSDAAANEKAYSYLWPLCALIQAGNEMEVLEPGKSYMLPLMHSIDQYYSRRRGAGGYDSYVVRLGGGDRFFDDNQWIGLAYMDAFRRNKKRIFLQKSEEIYQFMMTGFDSVTGGGLYWKEGDLSSKNTCSNGPGVLLALKLFGATGRRSYLDTALQLYRWTNAHLRSPAGVYYDAVRTREGRIDSALYTYNTGTMLEANVLLFRITKDAGYLAEARRLAAASLKAFFKEGHFPDGPWFNAVLVRGYQALFAIDHHDRSYLDAVRSDALYIWNHGSDERKLVGKGAVKKLLDQAGYLEILARIGEMEGK